MQENNNLPDHLELLHEMNRLFLSYLQGCARRGGACWPSLPATLSAALRRADDAHLDLIATLPQALFRIDPDVAGAAEAPLTGFSAETRARYCLQASLLQGARSLCRRNSHLAQTFLRLPAKALIRLRCMPLVELAAIAESTDLIGLSFPDEPWMWTELLSSEPLSDQRRVRLIALQPRAAELEQSFLQAGTRIR